MNTLSVWTFGTADAAGPALRALERGQTRGVLLIDDASVVSWPADERRPYAYQAGTASGAAALTGAFWGLVFGVAFLLPMTGAPADPVAGLTRVGVPHDLLDRIRARIVPGTSALFVLSHDAALDRIRETCVDADLLVGTLDGEQQATLLHAFGAEETAGA